MISRPLIFVLACLSALLPGAVPARAAEPPPTITALDDAYLVDQDSALVVTRVYPTYLAIGNSLTHNSQGAWNNNVPPGWGMNASSADRDYVSLVASFLRSVDSRSAQFVYDNGTARQPLGTVGAALSIVGTYKAYHAGLITIQLGENDSPLSREAFQDAYADLLDALLDNTPRPKIFCYGIWNSSSLYRLCQPGQPPERCDREADEAIIIGQLCADRGLVFGSVKDIAMDPANHNPGGGAYNWHPNDAGMQAYADLFAAAFDSLSQPLLTANDTLPSGGRMYLEVVTGPAHGRLEIGAEGDFVYTPDEHYFGADSFTYQIIGKADASQVATVTIDVRQANHTPEGKPDSYLAPDEGVLTVPEPGVLSNDTDFDSDRLTARLASAPKAGEVSLNEDGSFTYTPGPLFDGADEFTYRPFDGMRKGAPVAVRIGVRALGGPEAVCRDSDTIVLRWKKPTDPAFQAVSIQRAERNGDFVHLGRTSGEEFTDTGLREDRTYHYCLTVESPHPIRQTMLTAQTFKKIPDKRRGALGPRGDVLWCAGASDWNNLYRSDDNGETFALAHSFTGDRFGPVNAVYVDPFGTLFVSASDGGAMGNGRVYRSADNGATWQTCKNAAGEDLLLRDDLRAPASRSTWFHSTGFDCGLDATGNPMWMIGTFSNDYGPNNAYLYRSSDGVTFEEDGQLAAQFSLLRHIHGVAYDPFRARWFVSYGESPRQFSVSDDGVTFSPLPKEAAGASSVATFTDQAILMSGESYFGNQIWRSTDGGLTAVKTPMPEDSDLLCYGLKSFADGEVWLASFRDTFPQPDEASCLWVSPDHGLTWRRVAQESTDTANLSDPDFYTIAGTTSSALAGNYVYVDCWQSRYIARFRRAADIRPVSPPRITQIAVEASFTTSPQELRASWEADRDGAPIVEFEYAVGLEPEDPGKGYIIGWTSTGTARRARVPGIRLQEGHRYYFYVRARNSRNLTCLPRASEGVIVPPGVDRIGQLWELQNGTMVMLRDKVVTCRVADGFWVEEDDRAAALRVLSPLDVAPGDRVTFAGFLEASPDCRQFATVEATVTACGGPVPPPLSMAGEELLFNGPNEMTPGLKEDGATYGLGLLVRCWGVVRSTGMSDSRGPYFHLDDGSELDDGSGITGLRVRCSGAWPPVGATVSATGVAAMESIAGRMSPVVTTRFASDVRILLP